MNNVLTIEHYEKVGDVLKMIRLDQGKTRQEAERPHGTWEALGFQHGYAFCICSNCHKTMKLYLDSKNEFCCIADIRKNVVSCMYCGSDNRKKEDKPHGS